MLQAYKYRMYPSREQVTLLMKHIHACRFVYNHS
ncbi:MAG: putative transposase, partial [Methanomicrobiaceae archaeon]|nr:putative transposase [Methanomicrobiaceae archaeon]